MSAFYQCIGFAVFWFGCAYIVRAVAIFCIEEYMWPMSVLGWLNQWVFQWFFFRVVWQQYKLGGNMIGLGLIFVVPLSGYNGRPYRPKQPKARMFWRRFNFRPT